MPRQTNGTYQQPAGTTGIGGQVISPSSYNSLITDIGTEITNSLDRLGRSAMQASLPMGTNRITGMGDGISGTDGVTLQQLQAATFPSGTVMLFGQTAAPTGWTKITSFNDYALRIVSGTAGSSAGTGLGAYFNGSFSVNGHAVTVSEMPPHSHGVNDPGHTHIQAGNGSNIAGTSGGGTNVLVAGFTQNVVTNTTGISIQNNGSGAAHTHTLPTLAYFDVILASKN